MALSNDDIKYYKSLNTPTGDTGTSGGGIDVSAELSNTSPLNTLIPTVLYDVPAGSNVVWYYKFFIANINTTDNLINLKLYMKNLLKEIVTPGFITVTPAASVTGYIKLDGINNSDVPISEILTFSAALARTSSNTFKKLYRAVYLDTGYNPTTTTVLLTISCGGTDIGKIDSGVTAANGEIEIAVDPNIDLTVSSATRLVCPAYGSPSADLVFSRPNVPADGLSSPDGHLDATKKLGIWIKHTSYKGTTRSALVDYILSMQGDAA